MQSKHEFLAVQTSCVACKTINFIHTFVAASGVFTSKANAQEQVSSGLSTSVGATVLNLTLMWGICVIAGKTTMSKSSASHNAESSSLKCLQSLRGWFLLH